MEGRKSTFRWVPQTERRKHIQQRWLQQQWIDGEGNWEGQEEKVKGRARNSAGYRKSLQQNRVSQSEATGFLDPGGGSLSLTHGVVLVYFFVSQPTVFIETS